MKTIRQILDEDAVGYENRFRFPGPTPNVDKVIKKDGLKPGKDFDVVSHGVLDVTNDALSNDLMQAILKDRGEEL